ncbi:MAG: SIS domain-containing protein [Vicinamibacterales bacterium]
MATAASLTTRIEDALAARNEQSTAFFEREAERLAAACRQMSDRFLAGGRLIAFGRGPCSTDAQHVSVEFVHPVIVGKRALPALDLSLDFVRWAPTVTGAADMVMGFSPPAGDPDVADTMDTAAAKGAMTFALPGAHGDYCIDAVSDDPFIQQEIVETLYHTLWETVHVFFERRELGHDIGQAGFLYPFLGRDRQPASDTAGEVAASIRAKAAEVSALRTAVGFDQAEAMGEAALAIRQRLSRGGKIIALGNGGSATDANDLVLDCVGPPPGLVPIPAVSLSLEAASVTAIANDVGTEAIFLRQLVAHAMRDDVVVVFSTSGGSRNIVAALEEARKRELLTIAFVGYDGGEIGRRSLADIPLIVRSDYIPRIQEVHASMYHLVRQLIEVSHG